MSGLPLATMAAGALAAGALLVWPTPRRSLYRVIARPPSARGEPRWLTPATPKDDPFDVAAAYDLFAVCLRAGLPVAAAAAIVAGAAPQTIARPLRATAELLRLGADPMHAWQVKHGTADEHFGRLALMARRSARAGSALSTGLAELAEETRREAHDTALERAERAGVLISGPLGLCFLPAFICLGIVPVVVGLARTTLGGF